MRCLRRTLSIKWSDVVDNQISNKKLRTSFNDIRKGKIIRMPCNKIPAGLISSFCY